MEADVEMLNDGLTVCTNF